MLINNPALLQAVVCQAAEEAYKEEIVATDMEDIIGPGQEYADKQDWMSSKIKDWADMVGDRCLNLGKELVGSNEAREVAVKYYSLELGESFRLGDGMKVRRVPGGWIHYLIERDAVMNVFVPLSPEYQALLEIQ